MINLNRYFIILYQFYLLCLNFSVLFQKLHLKPLIKQLTLFILYDNWKRGIIRWYVLQHIYKNKELPNLTNQKHHLGYWNSTISSLNKSLMPKAKVCVSLMCGILNAHNKWFMLTIILTRVWMYVCLWVFVLFL